MASSTQNHQHHFPTTSAPPPTPSTTTSDDSSATDLLSRLLHRLPPSLSTTPSLLRRRSSLSTTTSPPLLPFPDLNSSFSTTLPSISELGFFQLTNHSIPSQLAHSAESDSVSIFNLSPKLKHQHFPQTWPLGFDDDDDDDDSLFLDSACSTDTSELTLSSLGAFTREMEKIGFAVVEALLCALGLQNPGGLCSMMWVSNSSGSPEDKLVGSGKFYPYVVGLHYQIRSEKRSLLADSGWVSVLSPMDSILVTLGDIAQVWSNGKLKKVRGKPTVSMEEGNNSSPLSMSLLITLPLESNVSPLYPKVVISNNHGDTNDQKNLNQDGDCDTNEVINTFNSFSFEDYAWRVYHERVPLKDPLDRYRT